LCTGGGKFTPALLTLAANLPPVSTTRGLTFPDLNDTVCKFATNVNNTSAKLATGFNNACSNFPLVSMTPVVNNDKLKYYHITYTYS
jgi:hypothetical protein